MALSTEVVARKYLDVAAGTAISVDIPAFEAGDIYVYYGKASLLAVQGVDYSVTLADDFNTITVTPLQSLLDKINALITADATETNYITVRRTLDYETEATADGVRYTPFTSREFDRNAMRDQQLADRLERTLSFPEAELAEDIDGSVVSVEPGQLIRRDDDGSGFSGVDVALQVTEIQAWFQNRDVTAATQAALLTDGSIVAMNGLTYRVDSSATGADSATDDLGVDGLVPYGQANSKHYGAGVNGLSDRDALHNALAKSGSVKLDSGTHGVGTSRVGEIQNAIQVTGEGPTTAVQVLSDNTDTTAFRVGANGGSVGERVREYTVFEDMVFEPHSGVSIPYALTGIDIQSVHPFSLNRVVMDLMGPDALKVRDCFYGHINGLKCVASGVNFYEVNTVTMYDFEARPDQSANDPTLGATQFEDEGRYPFEATLSDGIRFVGGVIEGWDIPVFELDRCDNWTFFGTWFEGNKGPRVFDLKQAQIISFKDCHLDFAFEYEDEFIRIDNSSPAGYRTRQTTHINVEGGYLLGYFMGTGFVPEFVTTVNAADKAVLQVRDVNYRGGDLFASKNVEIDVKSMVFTHQHRKSFRTKPNAQLIGPFNSWMPDSVSSDWDFSSGAAITEITTTDLTIATTTTEGEYMTGSRGVKISGFPTGAERTIGRQTTSQMGAVATEGETYLVMWRVKCDQDVGISMNINGGYADFSINQKMQIKADTWYDFVMQADEAGNWAQGRFFTPNLRLKVDNQSGSAATLFVDRVDYQIVDGDVVLG